MDANTKRRIHNYRASIRRRMKRLVKLPDSLPRHVRLAQVGILLWALEELHRTLYHFSTPQPQRANRCIE